MNIISKLNYNNRIRRMLLYILAIFLHPFLRVKKGRVLFFSYAGSQYSCNPRFISEYILKTTSDLKVFWLFNRNNIPGNLDKKIKVVTSLSFRSLLTINTAEFVITNKRTSPWMYGWIKKKNQKYIMTWHGGKPLKKIELDAIESLSSVYLRRMKQDSAYCNLFLSESRFTTNLYRRSFLYDGEILEKGSPRNDVFFDKNKHGFIKQSVLNYFNLFNDVHLVLYAPTFRGDYSLDSYNIEWDRVVSSFEKILGGNVKILIRLHPNFLNNRIDLSSLLNKEYIYDATKYADINDLMIASDVLISDYSSCMFDFAYTEKPCFIYAIDSEKYERGFYFNIRELPFPFAENNIVLINNIEKFNLKEYQKKLKVFMQEQFGSFDNGHASEAAVNWILEKTRF